MSRNLFIKNTFILIISSLIIKVLGLLNRILLTRLLGHEGISLYILSLPTIILFISLCGFSLNTAVSKIVAMNTV
ncbi:MAG TPA: oligosaccharide flippase family protein, partial [Bacilli bacterium]|nr:oligosaccharide flippase family protein [Bacilli bacterium]